MRLRSITLRVAAFFVAASSATLVATGLWLSAILDRHFEEQDIDEIRGKLELIRNLLADKRSVDDFDRLPTELARALIGHHGLGVVLMDGAGEILFASVGERLADTLRQHPLPERTPVEFRDAERGYRGLGMAIDSGLPEVGRLRVGVLLDITHHEHFLHELRRTLWSVIALVVLLMGGLGWAVARHGLRPLERLTARITAIHPSALAERVADDGVPPELQPMVDAFNAMLARLEDGWRRLSEFSSDIAHELRTPLANLRTQTEVSLGRARSAEEYRTILESALEEYEHLSRMVGDMLLIAKADNGQIAIGREPVGLRAQVDALIEFYDALAEDHGLRLEAQGEARIAGDAAMLRRALSNLLSNAVRHAAPGSTIAIRLGEAPGGGATLAVANRGADIPPEALARLFDRFYRADPSRQRDGEGAGLGLAITRSIVEAHGGRIVARSGDGETVFECRFPAAP